MSGNGEGVDKKVVKIASDIGASGKEVEPDKKEEPEEGVTEALLVLNKNQIEEKTSLGDVKRTESEQDIGEEREVSKSTSIVGVELGKEAETEEVTKAAVVVEKKMFWCTRLRFL